MSIPSRLTGFVAALVERGFRKKANRCWKEESGFFQLLDFQAGAFGNYTFFNVCCHPIGFPRLLTNKLSCPKHPSSTQCILRQRLSQISDSAPTHVEDFSPEQFRHILDQDVLPWLRAWSSFSHIVESPANTLTPLLSVVPTIQDRAISMLKFYCAIQLNEVERARMHLAEFKEKPVGELQFTLVDQHLESLLIELESSGR